MALASRRVPRMPRAAIFISALVSAGLVARLAGAAGQPSGCSGDEQCRAVNAACEEKFRGNDCSDLKLSPGVTLSPQEQCYVDASRRRCSDYDRALANCLLHGHPGIAGGCWHLSPGFPHDTVEVDGKSYYCDVRLPGTDACDQLSAGGRR